MEIEEIAKTIVDSAIQVHRVLEPGLLESAYQQCQDFRSPVISSGFPARGASLCEKSR